MLTAEFKGLPELQAKLGKIKAKKWARGVLVAGANDIVTWTAPYPPAPPYGGSRWYERGRGGFWRRKNGTIGGPSPVSQNLGAQWKVEPQGDGTAVVIRNTATYAVYVHDKDQQVGFHAARGWRTVQDALEKQGPEVERKIAEAIGEIWQG